jgi:adenylosuccinate synthase
MMEMDRLAENGLPIAPQHLKISTYTQVIMPYHRALDNARENRKGSGKIGTTGRGIGPCYEDKVGRNGVRIHDLLDPKALRTKLEHNLEEKNFILEHYFHEKPLDLTQIEDEYLGYGQRLAPYITNVSELIDQMGREGKHLLFEGAQGTQLDIDHGTYPFVTSSNTVAGNACCGAGLGPTRISRVMGVVKAYTTRVGGGPFPTELNDATGERIREVGGEFGATTGRPRRCGWLDLVVVRNAIRLNGLSGLLITKLDVLSGIPELKVATAYQCGTRRIENIPPQIEALEACEPICEVFPGWEQSLSGARSMADLPANAVRYLKAIEEITGVRLSVVSVGAGREETIVLDDPFA